MLLIFRGTRGTAPTPPRRYPLAGTNQARPLPGAAQVYPLAGQKQTYPLG